MKYLRVGVTYILLAIVMGVLAAHAWQELLRHNQSLDIFHTARDYLIYHGLALVTAGFADTRVIDLGLEKALKFIMYGAGIFSGALFFYALLNWPWLAHLAPLGGGLIILGWLLMLNRVWRHKTSH